MTQELLTHVDNGIATLTLNRPASRNALTPDMVHAMHAALIAYAPDPAIRLIILTGAAGAFCSGGDVKAFAEVAAGARHPMGFDQRVIDLRLRMEVSRLLHEMPKPTLAVLPGAAAGAGLSLALACDLRLAADDAKLTTAFAKIGVSGDFGGSYFLSHLVGASRARELYFTGRVVQAEEALRIGLVDRVAPSAQLAQATQEWAQELAALPTVALGYMKRNLNLGLRASLSDVLDAEAVHMVRTFHTEDHKAAAMAFVEKRKPQFHGR